MEIITNQLSLPVGSYTGLISQLVHRLTRNKIGEIPFALILDKPPDISEFAPKEYYWFEIAQSNQAVCML